MRVDHVIRTDYFGGSHYAFCRLSCGWTGHLRRWHWMARRDGRKHIADTAPRTLT